MVAPQYADLAVSRAKFDREIAEFRSMEGEYHRQGWFLVRASFPRAVVLLVTPQLTPPAVVTGVRFDYTNYDAEPPSVALILPFTGEPYTAAQLPTSLNRLGASAQQLAIPGMLAGFQVNQVQPLMQAHAPDDVPFLCIAGVREYHAHPAHTGDSWELHRPHGAGRLVRILEVIDKYGVRPITRYAVQIVPQVAGFDTPVIPE